MARSKFCAVLLVTVAVVLIIKAEAGSSMNKEGVSKLLQKTFDEYQMGKTESSSRQIETYQSLVSQLKKVKGDLAQEVFEVITSKGNTERLSPSRLKNMLLLKQAKLRTAAKVKTAYKLYQEGIRALGDSVMRDLRKADAQFQDVLLLMYNQETMLVSSGLKELVEKGVFSIKGKRQKLSCGELKRMAEQKADETDRLVDEQYKVTSEMFREALAFYKQAELYQAKKIANLALLKLSKAPQKWEMVALAKNLKRITVLDEIPEYTYGDMSKDPEYDTYECDIDFMRAPCRDEVIAWTACATHHARFLRFLDRKEPISGTQDFGLRLFGSVDAKGRVYGYVNSDEEDAVADDDGCLTRQWKDDKDNGRTTASKELYKKQREIVYTHFQEGRTFDPMASAVLKMFFDLGVVPAAGPISAFFGGAASTLFGLGTTFATGGSAVDYGANLIPGTVGAVAGGTLGVAQGAYKISKNTNNKRRERNNREAERVNREYRLEEE